MGGQYGPYRQSERKDLYMKYVNKLVDDGLVYPCFCTDEELAEMKADAERKSLPPVYRFVEIWLVLSCLLQLSFLNAFIKDGTFVLQLKQCCQTALAWKAFQAQE